MTANSAINVFDNYKANESPFENLCDWTCINPGCSQFITEASLIAQLLKNLPAMQETPVQFLGWEDLLEKGKATLSSILAWRIPWTL